MPVARLSLVGAYSVDDDLVALFSKNYREGEPCDAKPSTPFLVWFSCLRVASYLGKDRLDLGNKFLPIPRSRAFQILRLMKEFSARSSVYA